MGDWVTGRRVIERAPGECVVGCGKCGAGKLEV